MKREQGHKQTLGKRVACFAARHSFRVGTVYAGLLLLVALLASGVTFIVKSASVVESKVTEIELKDIGELATQAGYYTSVQTVAKAKEIAGVKIPLTDSNYVFSYDGVIKAGIDFEEIHITVDNEKKEIVVDLPEVKILSNEIDPDSQVVYYESSNVYTPLSLEEVRQALARAREEGEQKSIQNGLLDNALENAKVLIRGMLAGLYDLNEFTLRFER